MPDDPTLDPSQQGGFGGYGQPGMMSPLMAQAYMADPRRMLVQSIMQMGQQGLKEPTYSPLSALAKALTVGIGGYAGGELANQYSGGMNLDEMGDSAERVLGPHHAVTVGLRQKNSPMTQFAAAQQFGPAMAAMSKVQEVRPNTIAGVPPAGGGPLTNPQPLTDAAKGIADYHALLKQDPNNPLLPTLASAIIKTGLDNGFPLKVGDDGRIVAGAPVGAATPGYRAGVAGAVAGAELPAKLAVVGAEGGQARQTAARGYELETGQPASAVPGGGNLGVGGAPRTGGGPLSSGPPAAPSTAPPASVPALGGPHAAVTGTGPGYTEPLPTAKGTVIPPLSTYTPPVGKIPVTTANANSAATEKDWNGLRQGLGVGINQLTTLANSFETVQSGGLTTHRAEIASTLEGLGMPALAKMVMSSSDVAAVQTAQWNAMQDVMRQLKAANAGTGGRILKTEFDAYLEHGYKPDMQPGSLRNAVSQQLGNFYQLRNMIDDYGTAKHIGYPDANQFQTEYLKLPQNSLENHIEYAKSTLPEFKGTATPAGRPAPGDTPAPVEPSYTNPTTKHRIILRNGAWVDAITGKALTP